MARTYNQDCVFAYALDLLGERWTLLIVRELFLGPRRFGDLHAALPGLGTNLLSKRLKELEEAALIESASHDAGRSQYKLTETGEDLRPTVRAMMFWSIHYFMARPDPCPPHDCIYSNDLQPDSVALAVEMFANKCALPHENYVLRLKIDDNPYTYYFMNEEMVAQRGADVPSAAQIETSVELLMQGMRGEIFLPAMRDGVKSSGDEKVIDHFLASFTPGSDVAYEVAQQIAEHKRAGQIATDPSKPKKSSVTA